MRKMRNANIANNNFTTYYIYKAYIRVHLVGSEWAVDVCYFAFIFLFKWQFQRQQQHVN